MMLQMLGLEGLLALLRYVDRPAGAERPSRDEAEAPAANDND